MSLKKNQKNYNKAIMQSGLKSNEYINTNLGLIQDYVTDYSGRNDFWTNKLNNRQLDLLSDKYLAQNANMLRNQAAFGSNSETNRQLENNAYSQQNYLANTLNNNVLAANQLQNNELSALMNATNINYSNRDAGAQAAANVDAANNAWLGALGKGLSSAGTVVSTVFPGVGTAVGSAMQGIGGTLSGIADTSSTGYNDAQQQYITNAWRQFGNSQAVRNGVNNLGSVVSNWNSNRKFGNIGDFSTQGNTRNV